MSSKFDMTRTKINYSYDQDTGTGMGTLTIKRNKVSLADTLLLMAGGFAHTIAVEGVEFAGSNIYFDRVLEKFTFDDTPAPGCRPEQKYNPIFYHSYVWPENYIRCYTLVKNPNKKTPPEISHVPLCIPVQEYHQR